MTSCELFLYDELGKTTTEKIMTQLLHKHEPTQLHVTDKAWWKGCARLHANLTRQQSSYVDIYASIASFSQNDLHYQFSYQFLLTFPGDGSQGQFRSQGQFHNRDGQTYYPGLERRVCALVLSYLILNKGMPEHCIVFQPNAYPEIFGVQET